jgi:hypothetical protein
VRFISGIGPGVSPDLDTPEASVPEDPGALYSLVFRVWLIRSLTPPKTELPATIANRRPKILKNIVASFVPKIKHRRLGKGAIPSLFNVC